MRTMNVQIFEVVDRAEVHAWVRLDDPFGADGVTTSVRFTTAASDYQDPAHALQDMLVQVIEYL